MAFYDPDWTATGSFVELWPDGPRYWYQPDPRVSASAGPIKPRVRVKAGSRPIPEPYLIVDEATEISAEAWERYAARAFKP